MIWAYISAAAAVAALATGGWLGYKHMEGEVLKAEIKATAAEGRAKSWEEAYGREANTVKIVERVGATQIKTITQFVEVEREIPTEVACVAEPGTGKSVLPDSFRVSWDRSVSTANAAISAPDLFDGSPAAPAASPVDPSAVLKSFNSIALAYSTVSLRWVGLQDWVKQNCGPFASEKK